MLRATCSSTVTCKKWHYDIRGRGSLGDIIKLCEWVLCHKDCVCEHIIPNAASAETGFTLISYETIYRPCLSNASSN